MGQVLGVQVELRGVRAVPRRPESLSFWFGMAPHSHAAGFLAAFIAANRWPGRKRPCDGSTCTQSVLGAHEEASCVHRGLGRHCTYSVNGYG